MPATRLSSRRFSLDALTGPPLRALSRKTQSALTLARSEYKEPGVRGKEIALFLGYIVAGLNDAAPGSVLPSIQEHYKIGYITVSTIFIANLAGWIIAAGLCPFFTDKFGFGKAVSFFSILAVIPYTVFIPLPPFGLFATVFVFSGLSVGSQDSLANAWMSNRPRPELRLGFLHFIYGVGALLAPLCAAPFNKASFSFSYFYAIPLGCAVLNFAAVTAAWRFKREEDDEKARKQHREASASNNNASHGPQSLELHTLTNTPSRSTPNTPAYELKQPPLAHMPRENSQEDIRANDSGVETPPERSASPQHEPAPLTIMTTKEKYAILMRNRNVHFLALFALFYVGCEVTVGGWTSSFLLAKKSTNLDIGGVNGLVSGFWAGIAVGRVLLIPLTAWIGAQLAVFVYLGLAFGLQLVVWLAPHIVADGVALAFMGLFLGPIFPIMIEISSKKIRPRALHTAAIAYIVSLGSAGSALFPFIVGLIAQAKGIQVLAPILVALLGGQMLIWTLLGDPRKKLEDQDRVD